MLFNSYNSSSIKVLKGLDAVRKRPGMYIGDTCDGTGLHHMVFEIIDNSVDEFLAGFCNNIIVKLYKDDSVSVLDNGRGIPTGIHNKYNISCVELVMTVLHSGGKFDNNSYNISGGLHGVGISVVNALSEKLKIKIYRKNKIYYQIYKYGIPKNSLSVIGKTDITGTYIHFWPDKKIFNNFNKFKYKILFKRLNELSYLNSGLNINLIDIKNKKNNIFFNKGGIKSFLINIIGKKKVIHKNIFYLRKNKNNFFIELVFQWIDSIKNKILCFTNNIFQIDGGTHLSGLKSSITKTVNLYLSKELFHKKSKFNIIGNDTREGLYSILSIKIVNPKFSSQTKDKLISSEIKYLVESFVCNSLYNFFLENPKDTKNIINKIINSCKNREILRKSRELSKKKLGLDLFSISNKLADCQEKNPKLSEIFLVEGDSAGGSAKQSRNRINQAILPLKGKIINVEKTSLDKILLSKEINILISVLGCGIICKNFKLNKLRYNRIIIMTDADVDGAHIRTLLLTFFYRYMPELILNGFIYIARPPLYRIKYKNEEFYINNNKDLMKYKFYFSFKNINLYKEKDVLLLNNKKLINLSIEYINFIIDIFGKKSDFIIYIFNNLIFFKKININYLDNIYLWLNDFLLLLNNNDFYKNKILFKIIKKNKCFLKVKFIFLNKFNNEIIYIKKSFFYNKYILLLNFKKKIFFFNENYKKYIIINNVKKYFNNFYSLIDFVLNKNKKFIFIQRYKGLGEMNPDQLWNTTMDPKKRIISRIFIEDAKKADYLFKILMGDNVESRRLFIENNFINTFYTNL